MVPFPIGTRLGPIVLGRLPICTRAVSTLASNGHIKVFRLGPQERLLTLLPTDPPTRGLELGTATAIPPRPNEFRENADFGRILGSVLREHAHEDSDLRNQARSLAGPGGAALGTLGGGAGGASGQGGAGGAGRGGWVHLSDSRRPPDFGRIAEPEDIFGSIQVDGNGEVVGRLQLSGTYRLVTNEGVLGLSEFLREKLVKKLAEMEKEMQKEKGGRE